MAPPRKEIEEYQEELVAKFYDGATFEDLKDWLQHTYDVSCNSRTLKRRLKDWGIAKRVFLSEEEQDRLRNLIEVWIGLYDLKDHEILKAFQKPYIRARWGVSHEVTAWHIVKLRKNLGMRRLRSRTETEAIRAHIEQILVHGFQYDGIHLYGRGFLLSYLKNNGHMFSKLVLTRMFCRSSNHSLGILYGKYTERLIHKVSTIVDGLGRTTTQVKLSARGQTTAGLLMVMISLRDMEFRYMLLLTYSLEKLCGLTVGDRIGQISLSLGSI